MVASFLFILGLGGVLIYLLGVMCVVLGIFYNRCDIDFDLLTISSIIFWPFLGLFVGISYLLKTIKIFRLPQNRYKRKMLRLKNKMLRGI